jgi:hypothetical protein
MMEQVHVGVIWEDLLALLLFLVLLCRVLKRTFALPDPHPRTRAQATAKEPDNSRLQSHYLSSKRLRSHRYAPFHANTRSIIATVWVKPVNVLLLVNNPLIAYPHSFAAKPTRCGLPRCTTLCLSEGPLIPPPMLSSQRYLSASNDGCSQSSALELSP